MDGEEGGAGDEHGIRDEGWFEHDRHEHMKSKKVVSHIVNVNYKHLTPPRTP